MKYINKYYSSDWRYFSDGHSELYLIAAHRCQSSSDPVCSKKVI